MVLENKIFQIGFMVKTAFTLPERYKVGKSFDLVIHINIKTARFVDDFRN